MNRIFILRTAGRLLLLSLLLAGISALVGEDTFHPKYPILIFCISSLLFTLNFIPPKNVVNKISSWSLFLMCFFSFYILLGVGFVFPLFFPHIGEVYAAQFRNINLYSSLLAAVCFIITMISSFASGEMQMSGTSVTNSIKSFDEMCKRLNFKNDPMKRVISRRHCAIELEDQYKNKAIKIEVTNATLGDPNISRSKIILNSDKTLAEFNIIVLQEQIEISLNNEDKKNYISQYIREKKLDVINFRATNTSQGQVYIEVSEAIEEADLWQDFIDFAEMLVLNLDAN